ncbi:MAG: hypothetical protein HYS16_00035 [Deltaproteobacteria bacterium]|nr:MAG: hypothetical protein HYS16_00035 [Deltaproteobacteria bacterium]
MLDWKKLTNFANEKNNISKIDWRQEAAYSICELYYLQFKTQSYGNNQRLDLRPGSDFNRFIDTYMEALSKHNVWLALFPNESSATSAYALDEALHLLADSKIIDRIFSGDTVTVQKLVSTIRRKRMKYIEL